MISKLIISLTTLSLTVLHTFSIQDYNCWNWNGLDSCKGGQEKRYGSNDEVRKWQSPPRESKEWSPAFQDYRSLTGYPRVVYSSNRQAATVTVRTFLREEAAKMEYYFNGYQSTSKIFEVDSTFKEDLKIVVHATLKTNQKVSLELDPINFVWQGEKVNQPPSMENGQKGAIVELFGWPYRDIEKECEDFLGKAGYMGVKVFPPQESIMSYKWPQEGQLNPWYFIYQPVSYRLHSRMGSRSELRSMIQTCRRNGVRVYADAVVNHMTGGGNDIGNHRNGNGGHCSYWDGKNSTGGSPYFTHSYAYEYNNYTKERPALEFPAVPYGPTDFHCERSLSSWSDPVALNYGWLVGLSDLDTEKTYVQERIADYFTDLMGIGFSGFRIDAAKHIQPDDLAAIMGLFNKNMGGCLPDDFISYAEVIMGGEAQMLACNDGPYNYYTYLDKKLAEHGISKTDILKMKIWSSDYPKEMPICGYWKLPPSRFVVQNDDHDQQHPGSSSRDMGDKGSVLIKEKNVNKHREFEVSLFDRRDADWKIKTVLSSYTFFDNGASGFPDGHSDCSRLDKSAGQTCVKSVPYEKAFIKGSCGYTVENWLGGKYTRVHRDLTIVNAMRRWLGLNLISQEYLGMNCY